MATRNPFTTKERWFLVEYLAKNNPDPKGRSGHVLYQTLCDNPKKYSWSRTHSWQSWRDHYVKRQLEYDKLINQFLRQQQVKKDEEASDSKSEENVEIPQTRPARVTFTAEEEKMLVEYLAVSHPCVKGRSGSNVFLTLCAKKTCEWTKSRTAESWRAHYSKNRPRFDAEIKKYQTKHNIRVESDEDAQTTDEESSEHETPVTTVAPTKRKREHEVDEKRVRLKHTQEASEPSNTSPRRKHLTDVKGKGKVKPEEIEEDKPDERDKESDGAKTTHKDAQDENMADDFDVPARSPAESPKTAVENLSPPSSVHKSHGKPAISPKSLRRIVQAGTQPVASSSKVQLSPPRLLPPPPPKLQAQAQAQARQSPRRPKAIVKDDVFYATASPSSSPPDPNDAVQLNHRLPKLANGHFGTHFVGRRKPATNDIASSSEVEQEAKAWPPRRKKDKNKGKAVGIQLESTGASAVALNIKSTGSIPRLAERIDDVSGIEAEPAQPPPVLHAHPRDTKKDSARPTDTQNATATPGQPQSSRGPFDLGHNVSNMGLPADSHDTGKTQGQDPTKLAKPRNSWAPGNVITAGSESSARARRYSSNNVEDSSGRRIDLRMEVAKRRISGSPRTHSRAGSITAPTSRKPSPQPLNDHISSSSRIERAPSRPSFSIADDEREHIEYLGLTAAIQNIAENSGYPVKQIWRVYEHYQSLKRTEQYVQIYRSKSANIQMETHEAMERKFQSEMGTLNLADERPIRTPHVTVHSKRDASAGSSTSRRSLAEPQLKIKPLPPNVDLTPSKYSPPQDTRAGQWNRLVGQGRTEEAMSREHRRASGNGRAFPKLGLGLSRGESNGSRRDDESVAEQLLDATTSDVEEDEEGFNAEEGRLFLSAHAGVAEELRAIEQRIAPDVMLRWVAARFKEMEDRHGPSPAES